MILNLCFSYDIMMLFKANESVMFQTDDTVNDILALIKRNPSITYDELTEKTGKSRRTVSKIITELKANNKLIRIGSNKAGHWEIIE